MKIELLWFEDCPNHHVAERMVSQILAELELDVAIERIQISDVDAGSRFKFPGSPTIRIDGTDVEPDWQPPDDFTPRCRLYMTKSGLRGLPDRSWVEAAIKTAMDL